MVSTLKTTVSDMAWLRKLLRFFFMMGDSVRPIVQKPIIEKFIGNQMNESVLDAGCGRGLYTRILIPRAKKIAALDYSKDSIEALRRRLSHLKHLSLHIGSADNLPFADEQFDLVTHFEVLEHIHDDQKVVSELYRVLQPNGRLLLSVPVPPEPIRDENHVREGYTLEQISTLLQSVGFNVIRHQYCMFNPTRRLIKLQYWWGRNLKFPAPSIFLLYAYWERFMKPPISDQNLPYDIVIEARKS